MRPWGRSVHPGSFDSFGCVLVVVGFIRVHWGAHWRSSGLSGVAGFIGVRRGCSMFNSEYLGSSGYALVVVQFIRGRCVHRGALWESSGSSLGSSRCALGTEKLIRGRWVQLDAPLWLSASSGFAGFIRVCTCGRRIHTGSLGSLGCALGNVAFIRDR